MRDRQITPDDAEAKGDGLTRAEGTEEPLWAPFTALALMEGVTEDTLAFFADMVVVARDLSTGVARKALLPCALGRLCGAPGLAHALVARCALAIIEADLAGGLHAHGCLDEAIDAGVVADARDDAGEIACARLGALGEAIKLLGAANPV